MRPLNMILALIIGLSLALSSPVNAGIGDKLKKKAEKKVEKKADDKADKAMDDALKGGAGDGSSSGGANTSGSEAVSSGGGGESLKPGEGVWLNYDFIPGDRVIYVEDFSKTPVGDFPQRVEFKRGNAEVAEWKGQRWLRFGGDGEIEIPLPQILPQRFTLEFDYYGPDGQNSMEIYDGTDAQASNHWLRFFWYTGCGVYSKTGEVAITNVSERTKEKVANCRVMGDGKYLKVYVNETRVANVPSSTFGRSNSLPIKVWAHESHPLFLGNFRIAEGGKTIMYDQLLAEGKFSTQGILFTSGSDVIRPESTPTLKEMGIMLKDHPDLKLGIYGHTDNVGEDAYNLDLSKRRAAAVKVFLKENYKIDESRLSTDGFGESKPVADNSTPEGRQTNRRVEIEKL